MVFKLKNSENRDLNNFITKKKKGGKPASLVNYSVHELISYF